MNSDWGPGGGATDGFSQPTYHRHQPEPGAAASARPGAGGSDGANSRNHPGPHPAGSGDTAELPDSSRGPHRGAAGVTVTRAVVARSRYISKLVAHKVISASQADGAKESGLTAMIWNQVMSYGADAMVTVALAGTVFFSASANAQRGNVLLYLLITMAPFAVVAPIIGPALDRVQHGRRWVMAGTAIGRAVLALVMAQNFHDLYVLFPAALGSLVLSKAYAVIRSAAAPRLVPSDLTLVEANARLSIFGLGAAIVGGGVVGIAIKITGSYPFGLWITAAAFAATAFYSFRLPKIVDALPPDATRSGPPATHPTAPGTLATGSAAPAKAVHPRGKAGQLSFGQRLAAWATHGFSPPTVVALQGESTLRWLSGFVTLFLAFYIESRSHGFQAVASLAAMGAATGAGNFLGTGIGTRIKLTRPDLIVLLCNCAAAVGCALAALFFSLPLAIVAVLMSAVSNALAKLSLDAIIQRDVAEGLRSSAFGRSETFLQLSWVLGATIAILLPPKQGQLAFVIAAVVTGVVAAYLIVAERGVRAARQRRIRRRRRTDRPGNVGA